MITYKEIYRKNLSCTLPKQSVAGKLFISFLVILLTLLLSTFDAKAQLQSTASTKITGIKKDSLVTMRIQNSGMQYQALSDKKGAAVISGSFEESLERGISGGVNYVLSYEVPYKTLNGRSRTFPNDITFSFSVKSGDALILGKTSDTANIEFATGSQSLESRVAGPTGLFKNIRLKSKAFKTNRQGTVFLIITNTNPETGDPLDPIYIEASFSIAQEPSKYMSKEKLSTLYSNVSKGLFTFPDSTIGGAWGAGMRMMTLEMVASFWSQIAPLGGFLDGYSMIAAQRKMQVMSAQAVQRHIPSVNVCKFPSLSKTIARSTTLSTTNTEIFAAYMMKQDLRQSTTSGSNTEQAVMQDYINRFRDTYCNDNFNGTEGLERFCQATSSARVNADINFPNFFRNSMDGSPWAAQVDFTDQDDPILNLSSSPLNPTNAEQDLIRLTKNLYPPEIHRFKDNVFTGQYGPQAIMDLRSLQAIRNIAKNSFAVLVGNNSGNSSVGVQGFSGVTLPLPNAGNGSSPLNGILEALSATPTQPFMTLPGTGLSYEQQMELLTKRIFQDPAFFVNLYDNPENVMRQKTAIKAVQLMQGWDVVKALHRREMLLAMLLEIKLRRQERAVKINMK